MSEWTSYSLHDLLIFSPDSYFRLFERSNLAFWPFQLVIIAVSLLMLYLLTVRTSRSQQFVSLALAFFWVLSSWWFIYQYYAQINTIAHWLLILFIIQSVFLLLFSVYRSQSRQYVSVSDSMLGTGLGIAVYGVFLHPFVAVLFGRDWWAVELFGLAPDPTALGSSKQRYWLLAVPLVWILVAVMTYSTF
jgi:uncharacterized membrane protein (UPF0136 family)